MFQLTTLIAKNPPTTNAQWSSFNQMTITVLQNINWYSANSQSLRDWLVAINGEASTSSARLLPASPIDYWYSMDADVHFEQREGSLKY
jgi:hypothetical protein